MATRSKSREVEAKPATSTGGYTVLARRYRSREFSELVGQEPIARTLLNAIKTNRTAHAYLFCGTRGVGKTSMARIFAKALNATDDLKEQKAIGDAILRGDDLDVIEIDGASNRGVNEARDLIAGAGLSPARSPYKIYIIDEVHMLTREAFNALLKTMEEPPAHVKFILCTTEPNRVPATIQSRCQRFDFRPIPSARIAEQLRMILNDEGVTADEAVVAAIARLGDGSMRDALSLMDRLLAGGDSTLTVELLEQTLGLPDHALVEQLIESIIASDAGAALERGAQLLSSGVSVEQALELLTERFRTLMVVAACGDRSGFLELSAEAFDAAKRQAAHFDAAGLVYLIAVCDAAARHSKWSSTARAVFDATLVRLCMSQHFADIPALLAGNAPVLPQAGRPGSAHGSADAKKKDDALIAALPASSAALPGSATVRAESPSTAVAEMKPLASAGDESMSLEALWGRVLAEAQPVMQDFAKVEHLEPLWFKAGVLRLAIRNEGAGIARVLHSNVDRIADLVRRATGLAVRVELDGSSVLLQANAASVAADQAPRHPAVDRARELFDAVLVSVEPLRASGSA